MLLLALCLWATADIAVKVYFAHLQKADYRKWLQRQLSAMDTQCLDCKRLRSHDDDCALDMSVLPPRSDCGADVR